MSIADVKLSIQKEIEKAEALVRNLGDKEKAILRSIIEKTKELEDLSSKLKDTQDVLSNIDAKVKEHFTIERSRLESWEENLKKESEDFAKDERDLNAKRDILNSDTTQFKNSLAVANSNRENIKKNLAALRDEFSGMVNKAIEDI